MNSQSLGFQVPLMGRRCNLGNAMTSTIQFELFCDLLVFCVVMWLMQSPAQAPAVPVVPVVPAPTITIAPVAPVVKEADCRWPVNTSAAKAMGGSYTTKISYSAWGEFEPGWNLDKRGKPLVGAALEARRRKLRSQSQSS